MVRPLACGALFICLAVQLSQAQTIDMQQARADDDFRWGVRAFHDTHFGDAVLSFEKSLSLKPEGVLPRVWLGGALYKDGYEEEAVSEWRQALQRDPGNSLLRTRIQLTEQRRGIGRELGRPPQYVVAAEVQAAAGKYHPLKRPTAVHTLADGSSFVVAFGSSEIVELDANNAVRRILNGGLRGYDRPFDCLELPDPRTGERCLWITEYGANRLLKANLRGERRGEFGSTGSGPGAFLGPQYLAADPGGYLYVTDWGNARVAKYDLEGNFVLSFKGPLTGPTGVAAREGEVFVADRARKQVLRFDSSGNYLGEYGDGVLEGPEGLTFRGPGTLLVADSNRVLAFHIVNETWETLVDLRGEAGRVTDLAASPNGDLFAVDFDRSRILVLSEMSGMYTGLAVQVERVLAASFPEVFVEVSVHDPWGNPVVGLERDNFLVTERLQQVNEPDLVGGPQPLSLVLVVEKSLAMKDFSKDLAAAVERLYALVPGAQAGQIAVVSAGEKPALDGPFGATRLATVRSATLGGGSARWRFDRAVRLAASVLAPRRGRLAVVFLGTGGLDAEAFREFSLAQVARYMANNNVAFFAVHFQPEASPELSFLGSEPGGESYFYFGPRGVEPLPARVAALPDCLYTLRYMSRSDPDFGRRYLDIQVEATLARRTGRAESGYFAPLSD
jgi:DNA-binding beta-propeller fold protein YncE